MPTSHCSIKQAFRFTIVTNVVIKFGWTPMKIVGEKAAYDPVLRKIFKSCHNFCNFFADHSAGKVEQS